MKRNQGFTLLEVQISAMLMIVVLIATGVIFYFSLASIRYMQDAFDVYTNATTAMNLITNEVIRSNCYGSAQGPGYVAVPGSFYGANGYQHVLAGGALGASADSVYVDMPTLNDSNAMVVSGFGSGNGLYLRQATQASSSSGVAADVAGDFPSHEIVEIYRQWFFGPPNKIQLIVDRTDPVLGSSIQAIADNVIQFDFKPIAYNCVHVILTLEGKVDDPMAAGVKRHRITLSKLITLRCAPSVAPIPGVNTW
ncbi:MAG: hypothetical protein KKD05_11805 [Candidatus Omnitrophica bacterium]|nr:hypothetical protein [Candidatus Omnitrophota bacterium]